MRIGRIGRTVILWAVSGGVPAERYSPVSSTYRSPPRTPVACRRNGRVGENGAMDWRGIIDYPLPEDSRYVRVGYVLKDQAWMKPALKEIVIEVNMSKGKGPQCHSSTSPSDDLKASRGVHICI
jgi:hypothetical protein